MSIIGADPDSLRSLSRTFHRLGEQLVGSRHRIEAQYRRSGWSGADADRFNSVWLARHRTSMDSAADACRTASRHLLVQADQQLGASDSPTSIARPDRTGSLHRTGDERHHNRAPLPPVAVPDTITLVDLGAEVTAASVLGESRYQVSVEHFGDRRRVVLAESENVGVKASMGGSLSLTGDTEAELGASARIQIGYINRRVFDTDAESVWSTLVQAQGDATMDRMVSKAASGMLPIGGGLAVLGVPILDHLPGLGQISKRLDDVITIGPEPIRTEQLTEIRLGAEAGAGLPLAARADASITGVIRAGTAETENGPSYVIEAEGSAAGRVRAIVLGRGRAGPTAHLDLTRVKLELIPGTHSSELRVTSDRMSSEILQRQISRVELLGADGTSIIGGIRDAVTELQRGSIDGAFDGLVDAAVPAGSTESLVTYERDARTGGAGASLGAGVMVGADAKAAFTRLTRRR